MAGHSAPRLLCQLQPPLYAGQSPQLRSQVRRRVPLLRKADPRERGLKPPEPQPNGRPCPDPGGRLSLTSRRGRASLRSSQRSRQQPQGQEPRMSPVAPRQDPIPHKLCRSQRGAQTGALRQARPLRAAPLQASPPASPACSQPSARSRALPAPLKSFRRCSGNWGSRSRRRCQGEMALNSAARAATSAASPLYWRSTAGRSDPPPTRRRPPLPPRSAAGAVPRELPRAVPSRGLPNHGQLCRGRLRPRQSPPSTQHPEGLQCSRAAARAWARRCSTVRPAAEQRTSREAWRAP
mmetsp:Transcript_609/g.1459  ORF Transcript_609/g.1459 Transcript_609/m.1459 type:complete len:294 (+) Transcript_609:1948-2829(+)